MILDVFNDIVIDRRDYNDNIQKTINIPCVYGSRSRVMKALENPEYNLRLPICVLTQTGIRRDETRVHSINDSIKKTVQGHFDIKDIMPVPITIEYTLSLMSKYEEDMDQLLTNFIPFFNPSIYVVHPMPNRMGNLKSQIVWDGSITRTNVEELTNTESIKIICETNFSYKTWIFPGLYDDCGNNDKPLIYMVNIGSTCTSGSIDMSAPNILQNFYVVPTGQSFDDYIDKQLKGKLPIIPENGDIGVISLSGHLHGYWPKENVQFMLSGNMYDPLIPEDKDYILQNRYSPDMVVLPKHGAITEEYKNFDWMSFLESTVSGNLSGWCKF